MSRRSATDRIKGLNSENKSGAIKQALDLIKNLEKSKAGQINPEAMSALGQSQVAGMLKGLLGNSGGKENQGGSQEEKEEERRRREEELEILRQRILELEQELAEEHNGLRE